MDAQGRFHIARDVQDWMGELYTRTKIKEATAPSLETQAVEHISKLESLAKRTKRTHEYSGDVDFYAFNRMQADQMSIIEKHYFDLDLFLKNIYWDSLCEALVPYLQEVGKQFAERKKKNENTLVIIHQMPLESAIIGEVLIALGYKNVIYNFNRAAGINSNTKSFEANLFLYSYAGLPWLAEKVTALADQVKDSFPEVTDSFSVIVHENDLAPEWEIAKSDPYILSAIGWKNPRIIYRLDEYPDANWCTNKGVKSVLLIDSDSSRNFDTHFSEKLGTVAEIFQESAAYTSPEKIGFYEEYVVARNKEYLVYKKDRVSGIQSDLGNSSEYGEQKASGKTKNSLSGGNSSDKNPLPGVGKTKNQIEGENTSRFGKADYAIAIGTITSLVAMLLVLEFNGGRNPIGTWNPGNSTGGSTSWSNGSWGGGSWSSGGSSSSIGSSSSSSSSSIRSFGGGGFSKGSGG